MFDLPILSYRVNQPAIWNFAMYSGDHKGSRLRNIPYTKTRAVTVPVSNKSTNLTPNFSNISNYIPVKYIAIRYSSQFVKTQILKKKLDNFQAGC